jgi:Tfp pilus assembly protein PilX
MVRISHHRTPRGIIVIVVLALLAVLTILCGVWVRFVLQDVSRQRLEEDAIQVQWLAEAGLRRAAAQLVANRDYAGEEWRIEGKEFNRPHAAVVTLTVDHESGAPSEMRLTAQVAYPQDKPVVQRTKTVVFNASP